MADDYDADSDFLDLATAILLVRAQLIEAEAAARRQVAGRVMPLTVGRVVVEFAGEIKRTRAGSANLKFGVFTADAKRDISRTASHKVTVEMTPKDYLGRDLAVSEEVSEVPPR